MAEAGPDSILGVLKDTDGHPKGEADSQQNSLVGETEGDRTVVKVIMPEHGINRGDTADLTVNVTERTNLEVDAVSAEVHLRGVTGAIAVRTVSGDIELRHR